MADVTCCGFPSEWQAFHNRHPRLAEKLPLLLDTLNKGLKRDIDLRTPAERVVFMLAHLSVEDFMEILLLSANGYGFGALRLLRGLFERAVTLAYIAKNPAEAGPFLRYHDVHRGKHFNHVKQLLGRGVIPEQEASTIESAYDAAKDEFKEVLCKTCGTVRTRFSWSTLDMMSMAREVGLEKVYLQCYYEPTLQAHSTVSSVSARMKFTPDGKVMFDSGPQRVQADSAAGAAHMLILHMLKVIDLTLGLGMKSEIETRNGDYLLVWNSGPDEPA